MRYDPSVKVSERERDYLRRLGAHKAQAHAVATASHLALSLAERLVRSMSLMLQFRASASVGPDDPSPFYERARRLGLYRP